MGNWNPVDNSLLLIEGGCPNLEGILQFSGTHPYEPTRLINPGVSSKEVLIF